MFSVRLTALSCAAAFLAGTLATLSVWNYVERGRKIESQALALESKDKVIDLVTDRSKKEESITNGKEKRIKDLEHYLQGKDRPMSPAVRAAIDSLYDQ